MGGSSIRQPARYPLPSSTQHVAYLCYLQQNWTTAIQVAGTGPLTPLNDTEITAVITELAQLWSECKLVHGRARHSQSQGSVERLNQTVQRRLSAWMKDSGSKKWARVGIKVVQWTINTTFTHSIKKASHQTVSNSYVAASSHSHACS